MVEGRAPDAAAQSRPRPARRDPHGAERRRGQGGRKLGRPSGPAASGRAAGERNRYARMEARGHVRSRVRARQSPKERCARSVPSVELSQPGTGQRGCRPLSLPVGRGGGRRNPPAGHRASARNHPQPCRRVRRLRAHDPAHERERHSGSVARRSGSRTSEALDRPHGPAAVSAGCGRRHDDRYRGPLRRRGRPGDGTPECRDVPRGSRRDHDG